MSPAPLHSPTIMNKRVQWEVKARPALLLLQKKWKKKKQLFCFLASSCSLSLSPTSSSSYTLLWFMVAIHLQAASIAFSLLGDHGSSCALWEGVWWSHSQAPTLFPSALPLPLTLKWDTVPVMVPAKICKHNPSVRPESFSLSHVNPNPTFYPSVSSLVPAMPSDLNCVWFQSCPEL